MFLHSKLPLDLLWEQNWWKSFFGDPKIFGISKNCFGGQNELAIYDFVKGWGISQPQTFQPQASTPNHSTSDFSTPWFKNSWLKSPGLKSSWLKSQGLKGLGLKHGVEKSGVEMSFNRIKMFWPYNCERMNVKCNSMVSEWKNGSNYFLPYIES